MSDTTAGDGTTEEPGAPDLADPSTEIPPRGVCPECGARFDSGEELRRHMDRHTELARSADGAGGPIPEGTGGDQAAGGAGTVQTE